MQFRSIGILASLGILTVIALALGLDLHAEATKHDREADSMEQKIQTAIARLDAFPYDADGYVPLELRAEHERLISTTRYTTYMREYRNTQSIERSISIAALVVALVAGVAFASLAVRLLRRPVLRPFVPRVAS
jgi:hypothetical protein